jgi:hypothetical protein
MCTLGRASRIIDMAAINLECCKELCEYDKDRMAVVIWIDIALFRRQWRILNIVTVRL